MSWTSEEIDDYEEFWRTWEGCEDFVRVTEVSDSEGYEWAQFDMFYSPSARRYFWIEQSGCSCNYAFDEDLTAADFRDGNYERAAKALRETYVGSKDSRDRALQELRTFHRTVTA